VRGFARGVYRSRWRARILASASIRARHRHLGKWEDEGWVGKKNKEHFKALAYQLRRRSAQTDFEKVKAHSNKPGNEGADALAKEGAEKDDADQLDLSIPPAFEIQGVKSTAATQKVLNRGILERQERPDRRQMRRNLDKASQVLKDGPFVRQYFFRAIHGSHKIGHFWSNIPHQQNRKALVLWFDLVDLVGKKLMLQMRIYDKWYIISHLWFEAKWSSGSLVILSVWSGLVGSGLALVWSCGKTNQSLPVFLMRDTRTEQGALHAGVQMSQWTTSSSTARTSQSAKRSGASPARSGVTRPICGLKPTWARFSPVEQYSSKRLKVIRMARKSECEPRSARRACSRLSCPNRLSSYGLSDANGLFRRELIPSRRSRVNGTTRLRQGLRLTECVP
jgi:hypothetical protein